MFNFDGVVVSCWLLLGMAGFGMAPESGLVYFVLCDMCCVTSAWDQACVTGAWHEAGGPCWLHHGAIFKDC